MNEMYVIGGQSRRSVFRKLEEWHSCQRGRVLQLSPLTMSSRICADYVSPKAVCADDSAAILFKSASLEDNRLYACTSTEVLVYQLPQFRLLHYLSIPCFNDLHHVRPSNQGTLLVVVTGLDMVVEVTLDGHVLREWHVLSEDPWQRFSRDIDYRKVVTTKPHRSHPNHVFQLDDEIWVTRFKQRDAISLTRPGRRIDIAVQQPHDGYVMADSIYFSTVDGHIVRASRKTLQVEQIFDLNQSDGGNEQVRGWCRGLFPVDETHLWVAFSRLRPTRFRESVAWIKASSWAQPKPSHIALFDLERNSCLQEIPLKPHGIDVVFSLFEVPTCVPQNYSHPAPNHPLNKVAV